MYRIILLSALVLSILSDASAQIAKRIYEIQGHGSASTLTQQTVVTDGIVTGVYTKPGQIGGFFIQDTLGDGQLNTSDAVFVMADIGDSLSVGDYVQVLGTVAENNGRTQLQDIQSILRVPAHAQVPLRWVSFPDDFVDKEALEGMYLGFAQRLWITKSNDVKRFGQITLSSDLLRAPTERFIRRGDEIASYDSMVAAQEKNKFYLDDASTQTNPVSSLFVDSDGTCRTGQYIDSLCGIWDQQNTSLHMLYPVDPPAFKGNKRTATPDFSRLGAYDLKICGFNVEHFGGGDNLKTSKVIDALFAMDADIYGLCEVAQGPKTAQVIVDRLNALKGSNVYAYVDNNLSDGSYEVVLYVYRTDKVEPIGSRYSAGSMSPYNRRIIQAFKDQKTQESFLLSLNHLKAKSGTGTGLDADQKDGQSSFNATRIAETKAIITSLSSIQKSLNENDVLIIGDLNSLDNEDPIRLFRDSGYIHQTPLYDPLEYSYIFQNNVQYLDYALANASMSKQITGVSSWHINADEWSSVSDSVGPYRSSDHDPILIGIALRDGVSNRPLERVDTRLNLYPNPSQGLVTLTVPLAHYQIRVFDLLGRLCVQKTMYGSTLELDLSFLKPGLYTIHASHPSFAASARLLISL